MTVIRKESRFINKDGNKYWLNMSWEHDQTLIHMQPLFEIATPAPPPPTPAPKPVQLALALGSGLSLLLLILALLLILCCCCAACPLAEWRRKRRKKGVKGPGDEEEAMFFTGARVQKAVGNNHTNGALPTAPAPPPIQDVQQKEVDRLQSVKPTDLAPKRSVTSMPRTVSRASSITANGFSEFGGLPGGRRPSAGTTLTNSRSVSRRDTTTWDLQREMVGGLAEAIVECCTISADSRLLVTATQTGPPCIWDLLSGVLLRQMEGYEGEATEIFLAANDAAVVGLFSPYPAASIVPALKVWDFENCTLLDPCGPVLATALCLLPASSSAVLCQVGPDEHSQALVLWDLMANEDLHRIPFEKPPGMAPQRGFSFLTASPDDRFALAGFSAAMDSHSYYAVFDLHTAPGVVIRPHVIPFNCRVHCSVILRNAEEVCTGMHSGRLVVWNLITGLPNRQLLSGSDLTPPHTSGIAHLVLSKDRSLLVSGDGEGVVKFWKMSSEFNSAAISVPQLTCLAVSPDGYLTATGSATGHISLWRAHGTQPLAELVTNTDITTLHLAPDMSAIVALNSDRRALILRLQRSNLTAHLNSVVHV